MSSGDSRKGQPGIPRYLAVIPILGGAIFVAFLVAVIIQLVQFRAMSNEFDEFISTTTTEARP